MPLFQVFIEKRGEKELKKLHSRAIERFRSVFELLEEDSYRPRPGCDMRVIRGRPRIRAVRERDHRGIFEVLEEGMVVWFTKLGHRKSGRG